MCAASVLSVSATLHREVRKGEVLLGDSHIYYVCSWYMHSAVGCRLRNTGNFIASLHRRA